RLATCSEAEAMVESFRVGGAALRALALDPLLPEPIVPAAERASAALRALALDPLLPEPIVPAAERAAFVDAMRRYDEAGRACWAAFLARHGVRHRRAPAHTRAFARGGLP